MTKVVFVGDKPSVNNTWPDVAFVGTPSHKNLMEWIKKLDCSGDYRMFNSDTSGLISEVFHSWVGGYEVIALGKAASSRLTKAGIAHYKLPHPSPRNRQLNNKEFINKQLKDCKQYLKEIK